MSWAYHIIAALEVPIPDLTTDSDRLQLILNVVFAISGAIAVLIIVLAGFRFITSQGNPSEVATARNAIIYALIGLVVLLAAVSIVNFVVKGVG